MAKKIPLFLLLLIFLLSVIDIHADSADEALNHYGLFKTSFAGEDYDAAFREIAAAESLDPGNSMYPFEAGQAYLTAYSFKRLKFELIKDKLAAALKAFQRAEKKGFDKPRVSQKIGECYYWLYRKEDALGRVREAYAINYARLGEMVDKKALAADDENEAVIILSELAENIFYIDTSGGDSATPAEEVFTVTKNYLKYSGRMRNAMVTCFANAARILGDYAFGQGLWDSALFYYKAIVLSEKETGLVIRYHKSWHMDEMVKLVEKRKSLGTVNPEYVHPILVIYVTETRMLYDNGETETLANITPGQRKNYDIWLAAMKHAIEGMTSGAWSVSFVTHEASAVVPEGADIRQHQDRAFIPSYTPYKLANDYDTYCIISNDVSGRARYGYYAYVPFMVYGVKRGWFQCGTGREYNFRMWLHEFYHTIGFIQENGPVHGWSGNETELAFYVRHFAGSIRENGWRYLNFRLKYRETILSETKFNELAKTFSGISHSDLLKAEALKEQAIEAAKTDRNKTLALCEVACAVNPYQEWALKYLADYYLNNPDQKEKATAYNSRYAKVLPEGKDEQRLGDLFAKLGDKDEASLHYKKAAPFLENMVKGEPENWQAAINLAELFFFTLNEKARAIPYYQIVLKYGPADMHYKWYLHGGQAFHEAGEYNEALSFYRKGLETLLKTDPASSFITHYYYWMALAYGEGLNNKTEAVNILEKAVKDGYSRSFTTDLLKKYKGSR